MKKLLKWMGFHIHEWEYLGKWGISLQQKRCKICNKLKIVSQ